MLRLVLPVAAALVIGRVVGCRARFGAISGMLGLVLGAQLTSATIHISGDLAKAWAAAAAHAEAAGAAEPSPDLGEPGAVG